MAKAAIEKQEPNLPVLSAIFEEDLDVNSCISTSDMAMPYLSVLEKLSPQIDPDNPKYIENAKVGMIHNNVTDEIFDGKQGLKVIPCFYEKKLVEWVDRKQGGGYAGEYPITSSIISTCKKDGSNLILPNGHLLVETAYFYLLNIFQDKLGYAVIGMSKTRLKSARNWCTLIKNLMVQKPGGGLANPPLFSHVYDLRTMKVEKNNNSYYIWDPSNPVPISDQNLYDTAKALNKAAKEGLVKRAAPVEEEPDDSVDYSKEENF